MSFSGYLRLFVAFFATFFALGFLTARLREPNLDKSRDEALRYFVNHARWHGTRYESRVSVETPTEICEFRRDWKSPRCTPKDVIEILKAPVLMDSGDRALNLSALIAAPASGGVVALIDAKAVTTSTRSGIGWMVLGAVSGFGFGYNLGIRPPELGAGHIRSILSQEVEPWQAFDNAMRTSFESARVARCRNEAIPAPTIIRMEHFPDLKNSIYRAYSGLSVLGQPSESTASLRAMYCYESLLPSIGRIETNGLNFGRSLWQFRDAIKK